MRRVLEVVILTVCLCVPSFAQKNWANKAEYDLYTRIAEEADAARQIGLLREWADLYPRSDFRQERLLLLASAQKKLGNLKEAFATAIELREFEPGNSSALNLIVTLGPSLQEPSSAQIAAVESAANELLSPRPVPRVPVRNAAADIEDQVNSDPESQRVNETIRDMRRRNRAPVDPGASRRETAEKALAWVKNIRDKHP